MELARLITAENDHVDLIGGGTDVMTVASFFFGLSQKTLRCFGRHSQNNGHVSLNNSENACQRRRQCAAGVSCLLDDLPSAFCLPL
jgi:hypothetical protein